MKLEGLTVNFLGDSITEGSGVSDRANHRYDNVLAREAKLGKVNNYGYGGTRIAHQTHPSSCPWHDLNFCGRAYWMDKNADLVVVYGGVNDYLHGDAPIGEPGDKTPATFRGAVWYLMHFLRNTYAEKPVVFMTPAHCFYKDIHDTEPTRRPCKLPDAMGLGGYVDIIVETAKEFDIPVLNLFTDFEIDANRPEDKEKYTADGLHFNDLGSEKLGLCLKRFLESL